MKVSSQITNVSQWGSQTKVEWLQAWLMCAGTASYSNSRQSHSLLHRAPWEGEMYKPLDFSTRGKKSVAFWHYLRTYSAYGWLFNVWTSQEKCGVGFLFILNCLDLIPFQILRESDETTKTFKCLKDIRLAEWKQTESCWGQHYIFLPRTGKDGWCEGSWSVTPIEMCQSLGVWA